MNLRSERLYLAKNQDGMIVSEICTVVSFEKLPKFNGAALLIYTNILSLHLVQRDMVRYLPMH